VRHHQQAKGEQAEEKGDIEEETISHLYILFGLQKEGIQIMSEFRIRYRGTLDVDVVVCAKSLEEAHCKAEEIERDLNDYISIDCPEVHDIEGVEEIYLNEVDLSKRLMVVED
jgi:hypothetical protein